MTTTDAPLFTKVAGDHATYIEALLATRPPTCRQIIAAVDAAAEGDTTEGDTHG